MPKLKNVLSGDDKFNLLISLIGLINVEGEIEIEDAAKRLGVSNEMIRSAASTISLAGWQNERGGEELPLNVSWGLIDDDKPEGLLAWAQNMGVVESSPRISIRQAAAIAAGLSFLRSLPEFANEQDIDDLVKILQYAQPSAAAPTIRYDYGSVNADIELLRKAILTRTRILCNYTNQTGEQSDRELDPIRLDPRGSVWYLKAWCPGSQALKSFRLDRMRSVELTQQTRSSAAEAEAERIDEIDDRVYIPGEADTEVLVEVDPEAYELVAEFATLDEPSKTSSGTVRVKIKVGYLPNIGHLIAKYGGAARVIEPPEAREIVKNYCLSALGEDPESRQKMADED
jgi:proteasome accessory factor C